MKRWYDQSVVYQIYPMSYKDSNDDGMGDINGIIEKLDYLKLLGVDILWLSPLYESPMDDNGYDISNYYEINKLFGTMEDFKTLLNEAHKRNLSIMMDLVVNHTSDEHEWFLDAKNNINSPYRDYYIFREEKDINTHIRSIFGGSAWELNDDGYYYFHMFSKKQPDLNWKNPNLRKSIYEMMNFWLDLGVDGFRMDVIDLIGKEIDQNIFGNGPKLHDYLQEMYKACFQNRKSITVGETGGVTPEIAIKYSKEDSQELDMVFQFQHIALDEVQGKDKWHLKSLELVDLKRVLSSWQTALHNKGWNSLYWSNHDQPRIVSRWGNDGIYRERSAKMLATLLHFMQGTPYIYQGEEIGMTNMKFTDVSQLRDIETLNMIKEKQAVNWSMEDIFKSIQTKGRDNARTPMQWSEALYAGFSNHEPWLGVNPNYKDINVIKNLNDTNSIFYYYQKLIKFRKEIPCIVHGSYQLINPNDPIFFHYIREDENLMIEVVANFTDQYQTYGRSINGEILLTNVDQNEKKYKPYEARVYVKKKGGLDV